MALYVHLIIKLFNYMFCNKKKAHTVGVNRYIDTKVKHKTILSR